jgi:hypothetical protein
VDLAPTILEVAGVAAAGMGGADPLGISLVKMLEGRAGARRGHAFTQRYANEGVRSPEWKLVRNRREETYRLYDLLADHAETRNVAAERLPAVSPLKDALEQFYRIDETGWHLTYRSRRDRKRRTFALRTDDRFETARLWLGDRNNDRVTMRRETRLLDLDWPSGVHDTLLCRTVTPQARISLSVNSETDFVFISGGEPPRVVKASGGNGGKGAVLTATLDPGERAYPRPERATIQGSDLPTVAVWYVPMPEGRLPSKELTAEELEEVEALGYLGD